MKEFRKKSRIFLDFQRIFFDFKGFCNFSDLLYSLRNQRKSFENQENFQIFFEIRDFFPEISSFHAISPIFSTMVAIDLTLSFGPVLISPK